MTKRIRSPFALALCLAALLTQSACDPYKDTALGLYDVSVGLDKLESFNEQAVANNVYTADKGQSINSQVIKAYQIKKKANERFASINPKAYSAGDKQAMAAFATQLVPIVHDLKNAGLLGIKDAKSQAAWDAIITALDTALGVLQGLNGGK